MSRTPPLALVTERQFQHKITQLAQLRGFETYHTYDSRRSAHGYPDLTLARRGFVVMVELKTEKSNPTLAQRRWLTALSGYEPSDNWVSRGDVPTHKWDDCGGGFARYVGLWRPRHFDHIAEVLGR